MRSKDQNRIQESDRNRAYQGVCLVHSLGLSVFSFIGLAACHGRAQNESKPHSSHTALFSEGKDAYNTRHKSLKQEPFVLNFLQISYIYASHLCFHSNVPLSFPNVEPSVFWSTEMTANPNQHWGRGKSHKCFKICDEYCRS